MKIVHAIYSMCTGGAELMLVDIANIQASLGHDVHLLIINAVEEPEVMNRLSSSVQIHRIGRRPGSRNPLPILKFNYVLSKIRADIVHIHVDSIMRLIIKNRRTCYVGTIHNTGIELRYLIRANRIFAISQAVQEDLKERQAIDTTVVLNGIDFREINANERKKACEPLRVVQVGRLQCEQKGQDILLFAVAELKKRGVDVSVDFMGELHDYKQLSVLAKNLEVEDRVNFLGRCDRSDVYKHLCDYDIFVQPSRYEGFGLTLVEAMGAKIPVVASDIDGPAEILCENRYGLLFESENPRACADAIEQVANAYPLFKANAEGPAYRHAVENYSIEATARNYLLQYEKLLDK